MNISEAASTGVIKSILCTVTVGGLYKSTLVTCPFQQAMFGYAAHRKVCSNLTAGHALSLIVRYLPLECFDLSKTQFISSKLEIHKPLKVISHRFRKFIGFLIRFSSYLVLLIVLSSSRWHIVNGVSNNILNHIILENNENKPVTNSRDTREICLEQGLHILKIFKDYHVSKTSIMNDLASAMGNTPNPYEQAMSTCVNDQAMMLSHMVWHEPTISL
ncbi:hypothetical protein Zm00014a_039059 [Zea mays]|uniref:YTH domain-containing family protein n=1 Tax=Zea mays TaxID=4577 RepID=A0A3L6FNU6_MAIZE|nr:hypothetical protein Zm00014a_039059 [Zea mays]